ncbi:olfactory receptor 11H2-like [Microcaecilia unicolor]|uniref:Olfactory receptor n=1 Tax=Microcaecilia unicolor TaxID=1415580 RepID=A0A6P7WPS7_9AMPH|nr:olfactory receptor 11H2-like [Microcaecilia unicolor]
MQGRNQTQVKEFLLRGLSIHQSARIPLFIFFLVVYILTLVGNMIIITLVWSAPRLHKPMYIFLGNLSFVEIWYTTSIVPKMLSGLLFRINSISFSGCFLQFYFFFCFGTMECTLLTVMGYDRYLAICHPLRYNILMNSKICSCLVAFCWICGFIWPLALISLVLRQPFCGSNELNHFLCDPGPLLEHSCIRSYGTEVAISGCIALLVLCTFFFTFISYTFIIKTIIKIPSSSGRLKAFSTCASHLIVVTIFFGCVMYMYIRPPGNHPFYMDKVVAVFYTVVTPLLNPVIYTLRNKEVLQVMKKLMQIH